MQKGCLLYYWDNQLVNVSNGSFVEDPGHSGRTAVGRPAGSGQYPFYFRREASQFL
jgi:hypothetical protein